MASHPDLMVRGIEPVEALIDQAVRSNGIAKELITLGSGLSLPYADQSFDAVIELGVLHHVARPNAVVAEMMRVARKAVFLSDYNRFGAGSHVVRLTKLILSRIGLWKFVYALRTTGKGYVLSEGDGLAYSYSVFDSFDLLAPWAGRIVLVPTSSQKATNWFHPLLTASHVLLCAVREESRRFD